MISANDITKLTRAVNALENLARETTQSACNGQDVVAEQFYANLVAEARTALGNLRRYRKERLAVNRLNSAFAAWEEMQ